MPEMILVETHGRVGLIRLNRPQALNALCDQLMDELGDAAAGLRRRPGHRRHRADRIEKAFAAGADIKEMKDRDLPGRVPRRLHRAAGRPCCGSASR